MHIEHLIGLPPLLASWRLGVLLVLDLLSQVRELVGQGHAVVAVDVAPVPNYIVWIWESIVHGLLGGPHPHGLLLLLLLLQLLLLPGQFVLVQLVLGCVLLDLLLGLEIQIVLDWVLLLEALVGLRQLSALVHYHFYLVEVRTKVL